MRMGVERVRLSMPRTSTSTKGRIERVSELCSATAVAAFFHALVSLVSSVDPATWGLCSSSSSSLSWHIGSNDQRCPWSSAALQDSLMPVSEPLLICCNQQLRGRPGGLCHWALGRCPDLTSTACFSTWWAGVLASSLITWPNSASRLLAMISLTFGRLVVAAMSEFFTWSYHFTGRICRWQLVCAVQWK